MDLARYEVHRSAEFQFSTFRLRPQASFTMNLREACDTEPLLQGPAPNVQIIVCGQSTLVPMAAFQEEEVEEIYNFCFPSERPRRIFFDTLPRANAVLLFSLDELWCTKLEEAFPEARFVSSQTAMLRHFATKDMARPVPRIFAYLYEDVLEISVFEESRLLLCNRFAVHAPQDVTYYILSIVRAQGLDLRQSPIYLVGGPAGQSDAAVREMLRKYTEQVYCVNPTGEFNRHIVSTTPGVPYDLMTLILNGER